MTINIIDLLEQILIYGFGTLYVLLGFGPLSIVTLIALLPLGVLGSALGPEAIDRLVLFGEKFAEILDQLLHSLQSLIDSVPFLSQLDGIITHLLG